MIILGGSGQIWGLVQALWSSPGDHNLHKDGRWTLNHHGSVDPGTKAELKRLRRRSRAFPCQHALGTPSHRDDLRVTRGVCSRTLQLPVRAADYQLVSDWLQSCRSLKSASGSWPCFAVQVWELPSTSRRKR